MPWITRNKPVRIQSVSKSTERTAFLRFSGILFIRKSMSMQSTAITQQIMPLIVLGVFGIKEAIIRHTTTPHKATVGNIPSTSVFSVASTGWFSLWKRKIMTGTVSNAPSSTAQKIPGLPCIKKNCIKFIFA